jgi:hypothetical protein
MVGEIRRRLLRWLDRGDTYKMALEWDEDASFDTTDFSRYRDGSIVDLAVDLAICENFNALKGMAIRHSAEVMPHLLSVLLCVPEYVPPSTFMFLLPKAQQSGKVEFGLVSKPWRSLPDWSEKEDGGAAGDGSDFFPVTQQEALVDDGIEWDFTMIQEDELTTDSGADWFRCRALLAEEAGLADIAFETAALGITNGFAALGPLARDLKGLCAIVYAGKGPHFDASNEAPSTCRSIRLADFRAMDPIEKAEALLGGSTKETFSFDFWRTVMPLLDNASNAVSNSGVPPLPPSGGGHPIVMRVLVHFSMSSLSRVHALMTGPLARKLKEKIGPESFAHIALRCVYSCTATNELVLVEGIHNSALQDAPSALSRELGQLEKLLKAAQKFEG